MFNMKTHKVAQVAPYEKYHRENTLGPEADDGAPISEKKLPHRDGKAEEKITEDQMKSEHKFADKENVQIVEKMFESANSEYVKHRSDAGDLSMPPMNVLVEKLRKNRRAEFEAAEVKESNWTVTYNDKKQNGSLPKWPKYAPQHDKPVIGSDPARFTGTNEDPVAFSNDDLTPLVGKITKADVHYIAYAIKTGQTDDYDTAILAILKMANEERKPLSSVEKKTIQELKIKRTNSLLAK